MDTVGWNVWWNVCNAGDSGRSGSSSSVYFFKPDNGWYLDQNV